MTSDSCLVDEFAELLFQKNWDEATESLRPGRDGLKIAPRFNVGSAIHNQMLSFFFWPSRQGRRDPRRADLNSSLPGREGNLVGLADPTNELVGYYQAVPAGTNNASDL